MFFEPGMPPTMSDGRVSVQARKMALEDFTKFLSFGVIVEICKFLFLNKKFIYLIFSCLWSEIFWIWLFFELMFWKRMRFTSDYWKGDVVFLFLVIKVFFK